MSTRSQIPSIDLEIRVTTPWGRGGHTLDFVLNSPSRALDFYQEPIAGHPLHAPERFQKQLFQQLEGLHHRRDVEGEVIDRRSVLLELNALGHDLYQALFPRELRRIYRDVREKVRTLLIVSDEPWIPWEILRPYEFEDDDFFCMRFQMSRWLSGETPLLPEKQILRILGLRPSDELAAADLELQYLLALVEATPGLAGSFHSDTRFQEALELLGQESYDLLHFAGHGAFAEDRPGEAKLQVLDQALRARHLSPALEKALRQAQPVVFLNACQTGRLDHSLTGLDGWAPRWVRRCGCSAFLAPYWSVADQRACYFAQVFYQQLACGKPLGEAVRLARHQLRKQDADEMAWLAYSLYGHPDARILLGDGLPAMREDAPAPLQMPSWMGRNTDRFGAKPANAVSQGPPNTPWTAPAPDKPSRSAGMTRRHFLTLAAGVLVLVLLGVFAPDLLEQWRQPPTSDEKREQSSSTPQDPTHTDPVALSEEPFPGRTIVEPPPPPPPPPTPRVVPPSAVPSVPLLAITQGKVAILVLDRKTRKPDDDVADAVESMLASSASSLSPMTPPKVDVSYVERLLDGDFTHLPKDGRSPWGVEYLLVATSSYEDLPQGTPNIKAVKLTLGAQLIAVSTGRVGSRTSETQTGAGSSTEEALEQAAERCLREITVTLQGGSS